MHEFIAIATYKRPDLLAQCLRSIMTQIGSSDTVFVVDNDPDASARSVVEQFSDRRILYNVEAKPGIAAARNLALTYFHTAAEQYNALTFIDDDEVAHEGWLAAHIQGAKTHNAEATFGPVYPVYGSELPNWVQSLDFFSRPLARDGDSVKWPGTGNVRIRAQFLTSHPDLLFSEDYSLTGGSDTDFFFRARKCGARLVWLEEAAVSEEVPKNRATLRWLWRRGVRLGNVSARMLRRQGWSAPKVAMGACARIVIFPVAACWAAIKGRSIGQALFHLPKGVGMLSALFGNHVQEYLHQAK